MRSRTTIIPKPIRCPGGRPAPAKLPAQTLAEMRKDVIREELGIEKMPMQQEATAKGRHQPGVMNKLEARYALHLDGRVVAGEIVKYWFEAMKLKLGPGCWYTPDFLVMTTDGTLELHETKGFMRDDARVKLSVCKAMHPYPILVVKWVNGQWEIKSA